MNERKIYQQWRSLLPVFHATLLVVVMVLSGCNFAGYAAAPFEKRTISAVHKIDKVKTLVLVDDPRNAMMDPTLRYHISQLIEQYLAENKAVTEFVSAQELADYANAKGEEYSRIAITQVGRDLGARQVLYVYLENVVASNTPGIYQPTALVKVKVLDVAKNERVFPSMDTIGGSNGYAMQIQERYDTREIHGESAAYVLMKSFADFIARDIAELFYDHKMRPIGEFSSPQK